MRNEQAQLGTKHQKFTFRIPQSLYLKIERIKKQRKCTMNYALIQILEQYLGEKK